MRPEREQFYYEQLDAEPDHWEVDPYGTTMLILRVALDLAFEYNQQMSDEEHRKLDVLRTLSNLDQGGE
jgi:hypothetical protein